MMFFHTPKKDRPRPRENISSTLHDHLFRLTKYYQSIPFRCQNSVVTMISSLVQINEKAISLIRDDQDYDGAASLLRQAITQMESSSFEFDESFEREVPEGRVIIGALAPVSPPAGVMDQHVFSLYTNAMTIVQQAKADTRTSTLHPPAQDSDDVYSLLFCILFYNLGLSLHLQGLSSGKDVHLRSALAAYSTAIGASGELDREPFVFVMDLALLNNCGHVHHIFLERREFHSCLRLMKSTIGDITHNWTRPVPKQVSSFSHNILMNCQHHLRPAPVA